MSLKTMNKEIPIRWLSLCSHLLSLQQMSNASGSLMPWNQLSPSDPLEWIMTVVGFMTSVTGLHTEDMVDYEL